LACEGTSESSAAAGRGVRGGDAREGEELLGGSEEDQGLCGRSPSASSSACVCCIATASAVGLSSTCERGWPRGVRGGCGQRDGRWTVVH
jgi:hypothetical protein